MGMITTAAELVAAVLSGLAAVLAGYLSWLQIKTHRNNRRQR